MDLSVMICTWNNSRRLAITLNALLACVIPQDMTWELVLVNNNCTDDTDRVARSFDGRLPLVHVCERQQGLSRARNAGLEVASGQLIVFTDDDVKPCPEWITAYWSAYRAKGPGFYFGGPIESEFEGQPLDEDLKQFAPYSVKGLDWGLRPRQLASNEIFIGPNWACPAEPLRAVGGFDPDLGLDPSTGRVRVGEEEDLMERLEQHGLASWYLSDAKIVHLVPPDKCTLGHIASRLEAWRYNLTLSKGGKPHLDGQKHFIAGVPRWMYRRAAMLWLTWRRAKMQGKKGYQEYIDYRRWVGVMRALRELSHTTQHKPPKRRSIVGESGQKIQQ